MIKLKNLPAFLLLFATVLFFACSIEPFEGVITDPNVPVVDPALLPTLTTTNSSNVLTTSAASGGTITADGGAPVLERGVVWNTSTNPTIANSKTSNGTGIGNFTSAITNLTAGTTYYVRAYATNSRGTAYGAQVTFTTANVVTPGLPVITTSVVTNNVFPGAVSGGNITSDGGSPITARGVVWGTSSNPSLPSTRKTVDGTGTGIFTSTIADLLLVPNTVVNLRAYATNANGTSYGNQVTFTSAVSQADNSPALMTANINGTQYNHMVPYMYSLTGNDVIVENNGAPVGDPRYLKIQGDTSDNLGSLFEINMHIPNAKWVPGTYPLSSTFDLGGSLLCQANLVLPFVAGNPDSASVTGGSVTITEFNLTTRRIKGTFTITYEKAGNPTIFQITNGTFNYGLDASYFD